MLLDKLLLTIAQTSAGQKLDPTPWLAIAISVVGLCVAVWRNKYDVNSDNDKKVREMIAQNTNRIESIEDGLERKLEKLDSASDKLYDVVINLSQQVARLTTQVEFLIKRVDRD